MCGCYSRRAVAAVAALVAGVVLYLMLGQTILALAWALGGTAAVGLAGFTMVNVYRQGVTWRPGLASPGLLRLEVAHDHEIDRNHAREDGGEDGHDEPRGDVDRLPWGAR